jgi:hypothetical protein
MPKVKAVNQIYLNEEDYDFNDKTLTHKKNDGIKKIVLENDKHFILPIIKDFSDDLNERIFICGKSGCGKTFNAIRPYIIQFKAKYPNSKIYFFSSKPHDKAIDDLPIIRCNVDNAFTENIPDIRTFCNVGAKPPNLIIFDDIQDYKKKSHNKAVQQLRDEILRNGRSLGLYIVYLWHKPADRKNTEIQIFESNAMFIFPKTSGNNDYDYMASHYLGLSNDKLTILKRAKSNYIYITRISPAVAISDNYIMIL